MAREYVLPKRSRNGLECSSSPVTEDLRNGSRLMQRDLKYLQRLWSSADNEINGGLWQECFNSEGSNVVFRQRGNPSNRSSSENLDQKFRDAESTQTESSQRTSTS